MRRPTEQLQLINEMIADSWYMVAEYKLNLGPKDNLEDLVYYIYEKEQGHLKTNEKKANIIQYLKNCTDKNVRAIKRILKANVPYRLQSSFFELSGLNTEIHIQDEWCSYIIKHQEILKGWIQYNMIMYLQRRNPNVPEIVGKLNPPQERRLTKVIKYWKTVMDVIPVYDIYKSVADKRGCFDRSFYSVVICCT